MLWVLCWMEISKAKGDFLKRAIDELNVHLIVFFLLLSIPAQMSCADSFFGLCCIKGVQVDAQRWDGFPSLMLASWFGHTDVVSALLDGGEKSKGILSEVGS